MNKIETGCFCYLNKTLVYVNCIVGTMATVTMADYPRWHKRVPVCKLRPTEVSV